jgi:hypothetical protein
MKSILYALILLTPLTVLTNCATPIKVDTVAVPRAQLNLANPAPIKLDNPTWVTINEANAKDVLAKAPVIIGVTPTDYQALFTNNIKLEHYIIELQTLNRGYKQYYEQPPVLVNNK